MIPILRTREDVATLLHSVPEPVRSRSVAQARPALMLHAERMDDTAIPVGASKFGGLPDLPAGQGWPERPAYGNADALAECLRRDAADHLRQGAEPGYWTTIENAQLFAADKLAQADAVSRPFPLTFVAQLDLGAMAREPGFNAMLPDQGRLLVFYDWWLDPASFEPQSHVGWRVLWDTTPVAQLVRHPAPDSLAALRTEDWTVTLPPPERVQAETVLCVGPPYGWEPAESMADLELIYEALDAADQGPYAIGHQLAGWPRLLQHRLQQTCQLAANGLYCGTPESAKTPEGRALLQKAGEWQLVLQVGNPFIENGALYVMMRQEDILNRAFDRAWVATQYD